LFNTCLHGLFADHREKVLCNIEWYQDRFDYYNRVIINKIERSPLNNNPGMIPGGLQNIFGFLDCTVNEICRPDGPAAIQNAFWNG
jgi:hypothetical protein